MVLEQLLGLVNALSIMIVHIVLCLYDVLRFDSTVVINTLRVGVRYIRTLKLA